MSEARGILVVSAGILASLCISSAAASFSAITITDPFMKSSWRMQCTCFCYLLLVLYTWKTNKSAYTSMIFEDWKRILISGVFLGAHYCLWTLSLVLTSVAHSLLFLCSTPLLIIAYHIVTRKDVKRTEIIGVVISFIGMIIITMQKKNTEGSTWYGDLLALFGAAAIWLHFVVAERFLPYKPLMFLFATNGAAAVFCMLASVLNAVVLDGLSGLGKFSETFGYFYEWQGLYAVYIGVVVGFIGNGCLYVILFHTSPFVVSLIVNFEPLTGTIFAWLCGFQSEPTMLTWIGGSIMFIGNSLATLTSKLKTKSENPDPSLNSV